MRKVIYFAALITSLFVFVSCTPMNQSKNPTSINDDDVNRVASQLYCPICQNIPLDVCPSQACADWRELIRNMIKEGKSDDEIKTYFSEQYGWNVLSMPPRIGFNWLIYIIPPVIMAAGIIYVFMTLKKRVPVNKGKALNLDQLTLSDEVLSTIDRDLKDVDHNG
jgi:cytochrome c-type biogenesis protein CcmH